MTPPPETPEEDPAVENRPGRPSKQPSKRFEKFRCARCGKCCIGEGYVNADEAECDRIAEFLGLSGEEFRERYTVKDAGYDRYLIDGPGEDAPCVFLERDAKGLASCRIEPVKPQQCRDFPYTWRRRDMVLWCRALRQDD